MTGSTEYITLSDAIRLGAVIRPQKQGKFFKEDGSCALGAAAEAVGIASPKTTGYGDLVIKEMLDARWLHLKTIRICPHEYCFYGRKFPENMRSIIVHLNDYHFWSREEIADWVRAVEDNISLGHPIEFRIDREEKLGAELRLRDSQEVGV